MALAQVVAGGPLPDPGVVELTPVAEPALAVEQEHVERARGTECLRDRLPGVDDIRERERAVGCPLLIRSKLSSGWRWGSFELMASSRTPLGP